MITNLRKKSTYALQALKVHRKQYFSISVIIVVILSVLSFFVIVSDTITYNRYHHTLQLRDEMIFYKQQESDLSSGVYDSFFNMVEMRSKHVFSYQTLNTSSSYYRTKDNNNPHISLTFADESFFKYPLLNEKLEVEKTEFIEVSDSYMELLDQGSGVIISASLSRAIFGSEKSLEKSVYLDSRSDSDSQSSLIKYNIVGIVKDKPISREMGKHDVYISKTQSKLFDLMEIGTNFVFISDEYQDLGNLASQNAIPGYVFSHRLLDQFNSDRINDSILIFSIMIVIVLMAQLVIYSSFSSIYQYRLKEFGILLSIGAKKRDVFFMQMLEVLVVMVTMAMVSFSLALLAMKVVISIYNLIKQQYVVLYLSSERLVLLFQFVLVLSLICSLLVSLKSTRYKIIDSIQN